MALFFSKVVSSIMEIVLLGLIPFIWWLVSGRKQQRFTQWIGIRKIRENKKKIVIATALVSVLFILMGIGTLYLLKGVETAVSEFAGDVI